MRLSISYQYGGKAKQSSELKERYNVGKRNNIKLQTRPWM